MLTTLITSLLVGLLVPVVLESIGAHKYRDLTFGRTADLVLLSGMLAVAVAWAGWLLVQSDKGSLILLIMALPLAGLMGFLWWRAWRKWQRG